MKYLLAIYDDERRWPGLDEAEQKAEIDAYWALDRETQERGAFIASQALEPSQATTIVRVRNGETIVTDGPFAETKESFFSYIVIDVADLDAALGWADIVSCATISTEPLVRGDRLRPGAHVDLVGGFTPDMREADDAAIGRARVFVDTRAGATKEAGDIVQPLKSGVLKPEGIIADLHELARGEKQGRTGTGEITLFKSVGAALEDLAAGIAVYQRLKA
jgi:ornithine cyclodeaminase/alanine dehydrogenase-like protein (mu-crystallin family)